MNTRIILPALLALLGACATNPVTHESELSLYSESQEVAMGLQYTTQVQQSIGFYPDTAVARYVDHLGQSIAAHTQRPQLKWQFHVLDDPSVNAFALPGGFIFVTRGLMTHLNSDAELATVLGHEAGHVAAKHSVKMMSEQQLLRAGLGVGAALSPDVRKYAGELSAGLGLLFLKFSRDNERQADSLGFGYALADGYDARQMVNVFATLDAIQNASGNGRLPEWQQTHPNPGNRIKATEKLITTSSADFNDEKLGKGQYLHLVDGMTFGEDPRQGYFDGALFVHPDLKFQYRFPDGWKTVNATDAVTGTSAAQDAMIELRLGAGNANEAAQTFFRQQGVTSDGTQSTHIHGIPGIVSAFHAQSGTTSARGLVMFLEYGGVTYKITALATTASYAGFYSRLVRSLESFDQLTDPKALAVKPMKVHLERVWKAMTLEEFNKQFPSAVPLATVGMINSMAAKDTLQRGQLVKRVIR